MPLEMSVRNLRAGYGPLEVLHGLDLDVPRGVVTGLVGPNGAGKTTLLRTLAGSVTARAGGICWRGQYVERFTPEQRAGCGLVTIPADGAVFATLTVRDNLEIFAGGRPLDPAYATFPVLAERDDQRAGTLSGGEQRMLALSRALLVEPVVLLADEPSLGLSPTLTEEIYGVLAGISDRGATVVLADQHTDRLLELATIAYRLEHGEVAFAGDAGEFQGPGRRVTDPERLAARVRGLCLALPGVTEKLSHGSPAFFAGRQFVMLWVSGHHDNDFPHLWCAAPPGAQEALTASSDRYFRPPYVGHRGWIGLRLDGNVPWDEVGELLEDAYRTIAPARLVREWEAGTN